jgi:hypothetical protein
VGALVFFHGMTSFILPAGYARVKAVGSFEELVETRFGNGVNALCWPRTLAGDFGEVVERLAVGPGITTVSEGQLLNLPVSAAGRVAVGVLIEDQRRLREHGLEPVLDCINGYVGHEQSGPMRTDVCSFHADSATDEADTYLCTYYGQSSEGLRNEEAVRRVDMPEMRAELRRLFGGEDDEAFREYLNENFYDLHYAAVAGARPFSFGVGNLWRIATEYPGSPVPPCVHRAPDPVPGQAPRLLLIS